MASIIRKASSSLLQTTNIPTSVLTPTSLPPISERTGLFGERLYVCQECKDALPVNRLSACLEHGKFACIRCMVAKHKACNSRGCHDVRERKQQLLDVQHEVERIEAEQNMTQEYEAKLSAFNHKVAASVDLAKSRLSNMLATLNSVLDNPAAADQWIGSEKSSNFTSQLLEVKMTTGDIQKQFHQFVVDSRNLWNSAKIPGATKFDIKILHNGVDDETTEIFTEIASVVDLSNLPDAVRKALDDLTIEKGDKCFWYCMSSFNGAISGGSLIAEVRPKHMFGISTTTELATPKASVQAKLTDFMKKKIGDLVVDAEGIAFAAQHEFEGTWRCISGKAGFVRTTGTVAPCMETKVFSHGMEYVLFKLRD